MFQDSRESQRSYQGDDQIFCNFLYIFGAIFHSHNPIELVAAVLRLNSNFNPIRRVGGSRYGNFKHLYNDIYGITLVAFIKPCPRRRALVRFSARTAAV